jgi:hypothetical protein
MQIDIKITERLSKVVSIEASCVEEAIDKVKDMYKQCDIVLDESDFDGNVIIEKLIN